MAPVPSSTTVLDHEVCRFSIETAWDIHCSYWEALFLPAIGGPMRGMMNRAAGPIVRLTRDASFDAGGGGGRPHHFKLEQ